MAAGIFVYVVLYAQSIYILGNLHVSCVKLKCQLLRAEMVNLKVDVSYALN